MAETLDRLLKHIEYDPNGGCWLWSGGVSQSGYGCFWLDGRQTGAHRTSFELHKGPIPNGLFVCHKCDVRACVNPDHLWVGTGSENMRDARDKGRTYKVPRHLQTGTKTPSRGSLHGRAKISEAEAFEVLSYGREGRKCPRTSLAKRFGVSVSTIRY